MPRESPDERATARELVWFGEQEVSLELLLGAGDMGVMDCHVMHFGSTYRAARMVGSNLWVASKHTE